MPAMPRGPILGVVLLLGSAVCAMAAPVVAPIAIDGAPSIRLAAMGDLPTVPRRRGGGRRSPAKDKPYQPLAKDPVGESAAAHKDYLKRYGF